MVFLVQLEVFSQVGYPVGQKTDLYFRRTGITFVQLEFVYQFLFFIRRKDHFLFSSFLVKN